MISLEELALAIEQMSEENLEVFTTVVHTTDVAAVVVPVAVAGVVAVVQSSSTDVGVTENTELLLSSDAFAYRLFSFS